MPLPKFLVFGPDGAIERQGGSRNRRVGKYHFVCSEVSESGSGPAIYQNLRQSIGHFKASFIGTLSV